MERSRVRRILAAVFMDERFKQGRGAEAMLGWEMNGPLGTAGPTWGREEGRLRRFVWAQFKTCGDDGVNGWILAG